MIKSDNGVNVSTLDNYSINPVQVSSSIGGNRTSTSIRPNIGKLDNHIVSLTRPNYDLQGIQTFKSSNFTTTQFDRDTNQTNPVETEYLSFEKAKRFKEIPNNLDVDSVPELVPDSYSKHLYEYTASNGVKIQFHAYAPEGVDDTAGLPVHIHLWPSRNIGPQGYYNCHGLPQYLFEKGDASGIILCPKLEANAQYDEAHLDAIKELTDTYCLKYDCDDSRISVSGQGKGGQGALSFGARYPDYFSKVVSIYNLSNEKDLSTIDAFGGNAAKNLSRNDVTIYVKDGGGDYLDEKTHKDTNQVLSDLEPYGTPEVIEEHGNIYGDNLFNTPYVAEDGTEYQNTLEYWFSLSKPESNNVLYT